MQYNLNPQWKVCIGDPNETENADVNDNDWKSIILPYAWNQDEVFKLDIHNLSTGIARNRKHFSILF
ncbi:hypothetical protein JW960_22045 [candidate division KSB1 bacterium]|nr:hypothetical protein [candidate division KSB1 bacterium]